MEETLTRLFKLLNDWRELPAYQLERRADIFFALYLEDLLKYRKYFEPNESITIIPEFPAKQAGTHRSDKIDYMVCSERKVVYVELKTDNRSIRSKQSEYLYNIKRRALKDVLNDIIAIYRATNFGTKYRKLIEKLDRWIERHETEAGKEHYTLRYDEIAKVESVEVVYILPKQPQSTIDIKHKPIYFDSLVEMLRLPKYADDPIAQAFADALVEWGKPV